MGTLPSEVGDILFGRTRRAVLGLLLGRPDERFHMREIFRRVASGSGAVQRELGHLVEAGLVRRTSEGRQVYFSANADAVVFRELQAIMEKTTGAAEVLRSELAPLVSSGQVVLALVYGSIAAGSQTASSDVDLLVLGEATLTDIVPAVRAAEARLGREVNPSVYPVGEFRKRLKGGAAFLSRVVSGPKLFIAGDEHDLERLAR